MSDALQRAYELAAARQPAAIAIDAPDRRLTFAELDAWSSRLAARLHSSPEPCAVLLPPTAGYYAALVGCMKAQRLALPLDPALPDARLAAMARDLGVRRCLTDRAGRERAAAFADVIDCDELAAAATSGGPPAAGVAAPVEALHRILTSGTSGSPTTVTIGRQAEVVHAQEMGPAYGYRPGALVANLGRHVNGAGINGFWRALLNGVGLLCFDLPRESFAEVYRRLRQARPDSLQGQPTLLEALAAACAGKPPLAVERLIVGGETLSPAQLRRIGALLPPGCLVSVNYSSTETMHVACHTAPLAQLLAQPRIAIGQPLPSRRVDLLGEDGAPVAAGEAGEIVVTSRHLALALEGPGAERFAADPGDAALRCYWTRDLGRWNEAGQLEHLGRIDRQLKINGVRVDPATVEAELERLPGVTRAVVVGVRDEHDRMRLAACLQREAARAGDDVLRATLAARLPPAFVPTQWLDVDAVPIGPTGKTDLQALQARAAAALRSTAEAAADDSPLLALLRAQWSAALRRPLGAVPGSFFDEGGDSLAAAVLVTALGRLGAGELGPLWVAQHPTLAAQMQALRREGARLLAALPGGAAAPAAAAADDAAAADRAEILRRIGWA